MHTHAKGDLLGGTQQFAYILAGTQPRLVHEQLGEVTAGPGLERRSAETMIVGYGGNQMVDASPRPPRRRARRPRIVRVDPHEVTPVPATTTWSA